MIIDMRLRPPLPSWVGKPQFKQGVPHYPTRIGFPRPPSAEQRSMPLLFEEMARSRIRWGVIMGRASAEPLGTVPNAEVAEAIAEWPDKFLGFVAVDVSKPAADMVAEIERWMKVPGFKGVSIEPGASPTPMACDDKRLYPIYETCRDGGFPVSVTLSGLLCHMANAPLEFSSPLPLYNACRAFPTLDFVISHGAWPWVRELLGLAFIFPNIWVSPDLYMVGLDMVGGDEYVKAANTFLADRTLFGTAYPSRPLIESVEAFDKWTFAPGVKEKVLGQNAARLLKVAL